MFGIYQYQTYKGFKLQKVVIRQCLTIKFCLFEHYLQINFISKMS